MPTRRRPTLAPQVLILGGRGRIGQSIARDLAAFCPTARPILTGRAAAAPPRPYPGTYLPLNLANRVALREAVAASDLVVHCAGPFHRRDGSVLGACIDCGTNYLDVSDCRSFHRRAITHHDRAAAAGVTAVLHAGVFPGISNSLVRLACERLTCPEAIHLSYAVGGTGGAGLTVMRTTFLGLQQPFATWQNGRWQTVRPYSERETVEFPAPVGRVGVYWFDVPESYTLPQTWPTVHTVATKFGSYPDLYNRLTAATARLPSALLANPLCSEVLARLGYGSAKLGDRFSGTGIAMGAVVSGRDRGRARQITVTFTHPDTVAAAGCGAGSIAQAILVGTLARPGVRTVEAAVPTTLFTRSMAARDLTFEIQER